MLLLSTNFQRICKAATVYIDTNVFIYAYEQPALLDTLVDLINNQATFVTISSVEYEFTRGARSLQEIKDKKTFVRSLTSSVLPVGKLLESDKNDSFSAAMSLVVNKRDSQYTDYLLATALHTYDNSSERYYILSADVAAFPFQMFTVEGVISFRLKDNQIIHLNLISFDRTKYAAIIKSFSKR